MTATHTPGPWTMRIEDTSPRQFCQRAIIPEAAAEVGWTMGYGDPNEQDRKAERIGNAKLITAAPDLLAALKRWEEYARDNLYTDEDCTFLAATRAAITKAEG